SVTQSGFTPSPLYCSCAIPYSYFLLFLLSTLSFFFTDTSSTEIYTLSLHDALPIFITISTTPVIAGDSFEMDAVGALRLSPRSQIGRAVQQECRDRSRMPSSA